MDSPTPTPARNRAVTRRTRITPRLACLADCVPENTATLADVGTDHGLLPIEALRRGRARRAIATDRSAGPLSIAARHIARAGLTARIELRQGDGLWALSRADAIETLVLAGCGGALLAQLLAAVPFEQEFASVRRIVINPLRCEHSVRTWLRDHGFALIRELEVQERRVVYTVLVAEPGDADRAYREIDLPLAVALRIGPLRARRPSAAMLERWRGERARLEGLVDTVTAPAARAQSLRAELEWARLAVATCERGPRTGGRFLSGAQAGATIEK